MASEPYQSVTPEAAASGDASLHEKYMREFDSVASPQQPQRILSLQARRFASIPGAQWEGDWEDFSANMIRVEVNKTARGLEKITNDYRANRVTVDFRPVGDADEQTAETLDGLFRADVYRCGGGAAFDNAFDEGTSGGLGAWRLCNEYEDPYDPDNDHQVVNFELIVDADQSVYFDPNSKRADKSDAKWGCVITAMARQAFVDEYGEDKATGFPQGNWKPWYDWFTPDIIRICEWYQVEEIDEKRHILTNQATDEEIRLWASDVDEDELKEYTKGGWSKRTRTVKRKRVRKYTMNGAGFLKDSDRTPKFVAGPNIPIIVYYGKRWFIDNQERFRGHVQLAMDPQRIYNSQVSRLVETAGTSPIKRPYFLPEQVAGHEQALGDRSVTRKAYNLINPLVNEDGSLAQVQGPVAYDEPPEVDQVAAALLQITAADIAEITNADDGADEAVANVSHEAMDLAATRTDEKSSGYMDSFRLAMQRCGEVYKGMAQEIYIEEGREVQVRDADGGDSTATLVQPKVADSGQYLTINDFAKGKFNVIADVTESSATKRDKTVRKALGVAQIAGTIGDTDTARAALITAVLNMDGDGIDDFKAYERKAALQIGLVKPNEQEQQELEQAAQQPQQPAPAEQALLADAAKNMGLAAKANAEAEREKTGSILDIAGAHLKNEQARAIGGPVAAPEAPTGLEHVAGVADTADKLAGARLKEAQAAHLTEQMHDRRIRRGHELALDAAGHMLEERKQDHAEAQPANDRSAA